MVDAVAGIKDQVSSLAGVSESERQIYASDFNFYKRMLYFFELQVPASMTPSLGTSFFFPLILPPESISMDEPFAVDEAVTQGGGLYVEEDGIIRRTIRISGTTGFKPRPLPKVSQTALAGLTPEKRSFSRRLRTKVLTALSGQKHFQYLQDSVFRVYGDLKRDPATAEDTRMVFHNPRDEESWLVAPKAFKGARTKSRRLLYPYDIELLVLDKADSVDMDFSEDSSLLDDIKDAQAFVSSGFDMVRGAVADLTGMVDDLQGVVRNVGTILSSAAGILTAVDAFLAGVTNSVGVPYAQVKSVADSIDDSLRSIETTEAAGLSTRAIPDWVKEKLRTIADGLDRIGTHPATFETPTGGRLREIRKSQELLRTISTGRAVEAQGRAAPASFLEAGSLGTEVTSGDVTSAQGEIGFGRTIRAYRGALSHSITSGDSLVGLAARYLGDARLWNHIAVLNGLKPPFLFQTAAADLTLEESPFSGVVGVGDNLLIPTYSKPPTEYPVLPVLGVSPTAPAAEQLLGVDVALVPIAGRPGAPIYGMPVDVEGGSIGPKKVRGIACVSQAMELRVATERGSDVLYRRAGLGRAVGVNLLSVDLEATKFKVAESLNQDSRVANVRKIDIETGASLDIQSMDAEIELRGFTTTYHVKTG